MNIQILDIMWQYYLWYEHIPSTVNYLDYLVPQDPRREAYEELYDHLLYTEDDTDHFSFMVKQEEHDDYYEGKYYGFGYSTVRRNDGRDLYLSMVYPNSPADTAGMRRGQKILAINGKTIAEIDENNEWGTIYGDKDTPVDQPPPPVTYLLEDNDTSTFETVLVRGDVIISSVLKTEIIEHDGQITGYLSFKSFITPSTGELDAAFAFFKENKIQNLVLDMRYNGGGLLHVAEHLGRLIAGGIAEGEVFAELTFNDKQAHKTATYTFKPVNETLNLSSVIVIATHGTASASEAVINGLKPFIQLKIIGSDTYGKPVGMNSYEVCKWALVPITFKIVNAEGYGDYYHGLPADCEAEDDVTHDFGDPEEASLKEALYYLENGTCSKEQGRYTFLAQPISGKEVMPLGGLFYLRGADF